MEARVLAQYERYYDFIREVYKLSCLPSKERGRLLLRATLKIQEDNKSYWSLISKQELEAPSEFIQQIYDLLKLPALQKFGRTQEWFGYEVKAEYPEGEIRVHSGDRCLVLIIRSKYGEFYFTFPEDFITDLRRRAVDIPI